MHYMFMLSCRFIQNQSIDVGTCRLRKFQAHLVMKLMGNCGDFEFASGDCEDDGGDEDESTSKGGGGGGALVVVGVKLDTRSKELLTWALVKVAKAGDRVIALHVIHPSNEDDGAATLLAVKKFDDSLVSACDGLCKLKQIDLTLKVCRGTPVRKVLAREATSCGAISLVVGTSITQNAVRSPVSVARYCARHVRRDITVFGIDNGKILFKREGIIGGHGLEGLESPPSLSPSGLQTSEESCTWLPSSSVQNLNSSMALVPVKREGMLQKKSGWAFLRKLFLHKGTSSSQSSCKKPSTRQWLLRLPNKTSLSTICPDHDNGHSVSPVAGIASSQHLSDYEAGMLKTELEGHFKKNSSKCRSFSYQELLSATSNFKAENVVGKGGYSEVYKGSLRDGKEVAVKILKACEDISKQFISEIEILTSLDHKNIVTLLGFCFEENRRLLLVYNLLSRGSLEDNLYGNRRTGNLFCFQERHKIALGVAEALEHLHIAVAEPIIHRDVKSSNILLSDDFEPKLSDFGLARLASSSSYNIDNANIEGTFGYLAPEYVMHGKVLDKIDVYSYGVVLLELLSGRKPVDNGSINGLENLVTWAKRILKGGTLVDLLDPTLVVSHYQDRFGQMVLAASLCIRREPDSRPHMSLVVRLLQGDPESVNWAREQVNASDERDAFEGEQSATNIQSFINLALLNLEDDNDSVSSNNAEQTVSVKG